jgi:hypothetical protein
MKFLFAFGLTMTVLLADLASAQSLTGTPRRSAIQVLYADAARRGFAENRKGEHVYC